MGPRVDLRQVPGRLVIASSPGVSLRLGRHLLQTRRIYFLVGQEIEQLGEVIPFQV